MKPWLSALLLVVSPVAAGCGDDASGVSSPVPTLAAATTLNKPLPTGWPSELRLPRGSKVYDSADRDGLLSVDFESQELSASISRFLSRELEGGGWRKGDTDDLDDTITTRWTKGTRELGVDLEDTGNTTEVVIRITDSASPGATASTS